MEYNKQLFSFGIILAFLSGLILGYTLGSRSFFSPNVINIQNPTAVSEKDESSKTDRANLNFDFSAKEALKIADSEALNWAKDAYVYEIILVSKNFPENGKSNGWKFSYYSKEKGKTYEIIIKDGESRGGEEKASETDRQTLKGKLVDSPALAEIFFKNNPAGAEIISLKMSYDAQSKKFIWIIFSNKGSHVTDAEF